MHVKTFFYTRTAGEDVREHSRPAYFSDVSE